MRFKHIFGPVFSRRLGVSLGIDLVPFKYCPLNCVYCEVQKTTHLVTQREDFFPVSEIISEFEAAISENPNVDHITFSGAGEPTLYTGIGEVVAYIKTQYPQYKLALLTNGVLLGDRSLWKEIDPCDVVLPSLDAGTQAVYELINRPKPGLKIGDLVDGVVAFREQYRGKIWLEVFIIPGLNDTDEELSALASAINRIKPDKIQINSLDRTGTEDWVTKPSQEGLVRVLHFFEQQCPFEAEIISRVIEAPNVIDEVLISSIQSVLEGEPLSAEEISSRLDVHINEISRALRHLVKSDMVSTGSAKGEVTYSWRK